MSKFYVISDYCSIRDYWVIRNNQKVYSSAVLSFDEFATRIYQHFSMQYPKFHKMDKLSKLGFLTVEVLLRDKDLHQKYAEHEVGIILMNASSSLDTDRNHQKAIRNRSDYFPSPSVFVYTLPNIMIGEISIRNKFTGEGTFFIQEKFDPALMVSYIEYLFDINIIQCCIAGWVEIEDTDHESVIYLIEKTDRHNEGIANFESTTIQKIYDNVK